MAKKSMLQLGEDLASPDVDKASLTHDETLRANALALACRYYVETIVKDGDLYREMVRDNKVLKPATYVGVIEVAWSFDAFIRGELTKDAAAIVGNAMEIQAAVKARKLAHEQHTRELEELTKADRESERPVNDRG